jgi:uncharacterized membrane protein YfcA
MTAEALALLVGVFLVALLYSSVGHAGASGYIAVMSLAGLAPETIRPTALLLNVLVAAIASFQFWRAQRFSWPLFWPFALAAVPMAFLGGASALPARVFQVVVGALLLLSALWLLRRPRGDAEPVAPRRPLALGAGAGIGLLAGLTGTGGGIFLTPLLLLRGWARAQVAAGVTAPFVLVNSLAGLAGNLSATRDLPALALPLAGVVAVGGLAGSSLGSRRLPHVAIERLLALVLVIGGAKLLLRL